MCSRLQFLLKEERIHLSNPFAVGASGLHTDTEKKQEPFQLDKLQKQLCAMKKISTEKEGSRPHSKHSVTISGTDRGERQRQRLSYTQL